MPKKIVAANWKMSLTSSEGAALVDSIAQAIGALKKCELWIAPSFTAIPALARKAKELNFSLGAQNIHWESKGAFTGEISAPMLREFGCTFAIIGHSERRHIFHEDDQMIGRRLSAAVAANGITPILCIGETLVERQSGDTEKVLSRQLAVLRELPADAKFVIAYEPVWAIGTGKVASKEEITAAHKFVASQVKDWGEPAILYGGSVTADNFAEIIALPNVSGGLIGGASTDAKKLMRLLEIAER
jgi:triosephosphate isomerase